MVKIQTHSDPELSYTKIILVLIIFTIMGLIHVGN
jgi:hypothetical protein